jgi:hypothetical protein
MIVWVQSFIRIEHANGSYKTTTQIAEAKLLLQQQFLARVAFTLVSSRIHEKCGLCTNENAVS